MREANFGYIIRKKAEVYPESTALINQATGEECTYEEIEHRSNSIARTLSARGIDKGDRIGGLFRNSIEFFTVFFAAAKLDAVVAPLNHRLEPSELEYLIEDSDPSLFVFEGVFDEKINALDDRDTFDGRSLVRIDVRETDEDRSPTGTEPYDVLEEADSGPVEIPAHEFDDPTVVLYTSGSTGRPKGVPLSHKNLFFSSVGYITDVGLTFEDTTLTSSPVFHVGGLNILTLPLLQCGGTVILQQEFEPEETWEIMAEHDVSKMFTIPTMLNMMVSVDGWQGYDLDSLELMIGGGEPVTADLKESLQEIDVPLVAAYGLTETTDGTLFLRPEYALEKGPKCNGKPFTHANAKVVDEEGNEVPRGEEGELVHRGAIVADGYLNRPEKTEEAWRGGWFYTGDIARQDEGGHYYILGRKDNMIITGGENVYPSEVEEALYSHDDVKEVVVFGNPDEEWGEKVMAVVATETADLSGVVLDEFLDGRLAKFKQPKEYVFTDELPKSGSGKVQRQTIVDRHMSGAD